MNILNETTAVWLVITALLLFALKMSTYLATNVFRSPRSIIDIVVLLDAYRMTTMFLSFGGTLYFGIIKGGYYLADKNLTMWQEITAIIVIAIFAFGVSFLISAILVSAERTLNEGGLTQKQLNLVMAIYVLVAMGDAWTLYKGYGVIENAFASDEIAKIERKKDKDNTFIIEQEKSLVLELREELSEIKEQIKEIDTWAITDTAKVRTLRRTLRRCRDKHKPCPDTHEDLNIIIKAQRAKRLDLLAVKRNDLRKQITEHTQAYKSTTDADKSVKSEAIAKIEAEAEENKNYAKIFVFVMVLINFLTSWSRTVLNEGNEVETKQETTEEIKELREATEAEERYYVRKAIEQVATAKQTKIQRDEKTTEIFKPYPRDTIKAIAVELGRDNKENRVELKIGSTRITKLIREIVASEDYQEWLELQPWNRMESKRDLIYASNQAA